jgi:hypothetical protein
MASPDLRIAPPGEDYRQLGNQPIASSQGLFHQPPYKALIRLCCPLCIHAVPQIPRSPMTPETGRLRGTRYNQFFKEEMV